MLNPSKITNKSLTNVNHNYCGQLRQSLIVIENDMLILHEPIIGTSSLTRLQLVPAKLMNIVFIAFHTNAIGGHLNAYRTFHRLRLHFYWPGMYSYVKRMCQGCPGCALANPTRGKSSELVSTISLLKHLFSSCSSMHTLPASTPALRVPNAT